MIIDVHTHIFPDSLARRALASLTETSGDYLPHTDSTLAGLLESMDRAGIDMAWIASIATKSAQAAAILEWSLSIRSPRIIPLGSVHPLSPGFEREIENFRSAGFRGIKLHPLYQNFFVDDAALEPFFAALERSGMFVLLHGGYDISFPGDDKASPRRIVTLLERFPDMILIAAHFGGWRVWDDVAAMLAGTPCYFDTSFMSEVPPRLRDSIIERHGTDRLLFATDSPWQEQDAQIRFLKSLSLNKAEEEKIFFRNALALMEGTGLDSR